MKRASSPSPPSRPAARRHARTAPRSRRSRDAAPARRPPRTRDPARTREALLRAGAALFSRNGYDGTSTGAIAARARVNKALINYHFGGKQGLWDAILASLFEPAAGRLESLPDLPPDVAISTLIATIAGTLEARPEVAVMLLREVLSGGRHLDRTVDSYLVRVFGAVRRILERGIETGTFRRTDPLLVHLSLIGSLIFYFATRTFRDRMLASRLIVNRPPATEHFIRSLQETFLHGLSGGRRRGSEGS